MKLMDAELRDLIAAFIFIQRSVGPNSQIGNIERNTIARRSYAYADILLNN